MTGLFLRKYFAILILVSVALVQIYRARYLDQSPWKGGGFGMFATIDSTSARTLEISLKIDGKIFSGNAALNVIPPDRLLDLLFTPSAGKLQDLMEEVATLVFFDSLWAEKLKIQKRQTERPPLLIPGAVTPALSSGLFPQTKLRPSVIGIKLFKYRFQQKGFLLSNQLLHQTRRVIHDR